jgi:acetyl-CoA synthetase
VPQEKIHQIPRCGLPKGDVAWGNKDVWYHDLVEDMSKECPCESFDAETPLFILYTSGSTGKPKGVLHTTGGYLLYAAMTHKYVFDYQDGDIYCGHSFDISSTKS